MFTRNSKVDEKIGSAVENVRMTFQRQFDAFRQQSAEHVEYLTEQISQLQYQLSMANLFVGGGSLLQQVEQLDKEHATKIQTADDLRALAYQMLEAADNVDVDATFIGELADVGRQMMANQVQVHKTELNDNVATALATFQATNKAVENNEE